MAGNVFENLTTEQKIRMTVHKDVRTICEETAHYVGMDIQVHAMELIAELAWKKLLVFGSDLECFAKHAKRSTINSEDVKLLVRRNPSLKAHISKLTECMTTSGASRETKRKRNTISNAQNNVPVPSTSSSVMQVDIVPKASTSVSSAVQATSANKDNSDEDDSPFIMMLKKNMANNANQDHDDTIDST